MFYSDLWPVIKRGFISGIRPPNKNQRSGKTFTFRHPRSFALNRRREKSWLQFSGTIKVCCWWTTSHNRLQWLDNTMEKYLEICVRQSRTNDEECWLKGPLLRHDNAPVHMARVVQAVEKDIEFEQLSHPPYSTELAPSDFYLFRRLRKHLCGTRIYDDNEIKQATESYLDSMPQKFHFDRHQRAFWHMWQMFCC